MILEFAYDWEYWQLYHKVTFDGPNRLILINEGETQINFRDDVYSAWKEWAQLENHQDNPGYAQAMRSTGGDPIPGGALGGTFFLMNGWKIRTWEGDHTLTIEGNFYSEDGSDPFVPTLQDHNIKIVSKVSNLIDKVGKDCPTVEEIADAIRVELAPELALVSNINTNVISIENKIDIIDALLLTMDLKLDTIINGIAQCDVDLTTMLAILNIIKKYDSNRTRIDPINKTLTVYEDDAVTPFAVFALKDQNGVGSVDSVYERYPLV